VPSVLGSQLSGRNMTTNVGRTWRQSCSAAGLSSETFAA
jgi:hypothetical protein